MERIWNPEAKAFMKQHYFGKKMQVVSTSNNPQENKDQSINRLLHHTNNSDKFDKLSVSVWWIAKALYIGENVACSSTVQNSNEVHP